MNNVKYKMSESDFWEVKVFIYMQTAEAEAEALALLQMGYIVKIEYAE